jgi:hypothetical protein
MMNKKISARASCGFRNSFKLGESPALQTHLPENAILFVNEIPWCVEFGNLNCKHL